MGLSDGSGSCWCLGLAAAEEQIPWACLGVLAQRWQIQETQRCHLSSHQEDSCVDEAEQNLNPQKYHFLYPLQGS